MIGRLCSKPAVTARPDDSVADVAKLMRTRNVGAVVVVDDGSPVGLLTDRDITVDVVARGREPASTLVRSVMRTRPAVIRDEASAFDAARAFARKGVRRLPVVDRAGRLVGIIALDDIVMLLGGEMAHVADALASNLLRTRP